MNHTKGQWKIGSIITDHSYPYQQLRTAVEAECLRSIIIETAGNPWIIATTDGGSSQERDANARLIAAAPEMLEALKLYVNSFENALEILGDPCSQTLPDFLKAHNGSRVMKQIRAAIAKAEAAP